MTNPIYEPKGKAAEYCSYACNIYTGCNNDCWYCYVPKMLRKTKEEFRQVNVREGIVEAVQKQLAKGKIKNELIHLCFTCDPYPRGMDTTPTREIIKAIKESGNHVQILTKNPTRRDFDLLDENDWFGVTLTGNGEKTEMNEPNASSVTKRLLALFDARDSEIKTWISLEPVLDPEFCYSVFQNVPVDLYRVGKLNYYPSNIDWREFGRRIELEAARCKRNLYIKEDLRKEMG